MNIEEVTNNFKKYISFSEKECNFPSIFDWNWHMELANDIETLLTAYEKEKRLAEANLKDSEEFQDNMCNHRCILNLKVEELKQKEKQTYIDGTNAADKLCNKKWEAKIKAMLENEIINISGFECVAKEDVQLLLKEE